MPLTPALQAKIRERPKKPFRGLVAGIIAALLNHPRVLQPLLQYVAPPLRRLLDRGSQLIVTTHRDVREVMERDDDFTNEPTIGPAMVCGAFVIGTDRVPLYRDDLQILWHAFYGVDSTTTPPGGTNAVKRPDHLQRLLDKLSKQVDDIIRASGPQRDLDLVQDMLRPLCTRAVRDYLGVGPSCDEWIVVLWDVLAALALRLIIPSDSNPLDTDNPVQKELDWARDMLQVAIREAVAAADEQRAKGVVGEDVVSQMYDVLLTRAGVSPGSAPTAEALDLTVVTETVVRNIAGLAITGCHPISKAAAQAVDVLLDNPPAFRGATAAARSGDEALFWDFIDEALRFFPPFPLLNRTCPRDSVIGMDSGRPRKVRAGQQIAVGLSAAMFDPAAIASPYQFRTDRAPQDSLVFGRGMHACFGYQFAHDILVAVLMPLFRHGFERAPGSAGKLKFDVVVPVHLGLRLSPVAEIHP